MAQRSYWSYASAHSGWTVTRVLIVANIVVFAVQMIVDRVLGGVPGAGGFTLYGALSLAGLRHGFVWQFITYAFLHADPMHLIMNMLALHFFGSEMETMLGPRRYLSLYAVCGLLGGLGWLALASPQAFCLGASGAVFGVAGAFAACFPDRRITLLLFFVIPLTMTARWLAIGYGLLSFGFMWQSGGGVAHAAHLAGGLAGYLWGRRLARERFLFGAEPPATPPPARPWLRLLRRDDEPAPPPTWEEVDRVLDKLQAEGMGALTPRERETLERASRKQAPRR